MNQDKQLLTYRNARNQVVKSLGMGTNYPIAELNIRTRQRGELSNTPTVLYSKVAYETSEEIYIDNPQEDMTYELVELMPIPGEAPVSAAGKAKSLPVSRAAQPTLTLTTPKIRGVERTFSVLATSDRLKLRRYLDKVVKVQAGINQRLIVRQNLDTVLYDHKVEVTIENGQADCEYVLVEDPFDGGEVSILNDAPPQSKLLSEIDYSKDTRNVVLTSFPLQENTRIRVYGRFRISGADGYLIQPLQVDVIPNSFLEVSAVATTLKYGSQQLFDDGATGAVAQVKVENTQPSASYQAFFSWIDPTIFPKPLTDPAIDYTEEDWGRSQEPNGVASEPFDGTGETPLVISLNKYLPEDVVIYLVATNKESGKNTPLQTLPGGQTDPKKTLVPFHIYPDPSPVLQLVQNDLSKGERARFIVQGAQIGGYYQLYNAQTDEPAGEPQFMSKRRTIGIASVEIDLSVAPEQQAEVQTLELVSEPLEETTSFYAKVVKPINQLSERLSPDITVNIS